jgi:hypothetical protein
MPFKNFEELISMAQEDPEEARRRVMRARKSRLPVVDSNNPGYGSRDPGNYRKRAISSRMYFTKTKDSVGNTSPKPGYRANLRPTQSSNTMPPKTISNTKKAIPKEAIKKRMAALKQPINNEDVVAKRKRVGY